MVKKPISPVAVAVPNPPFLVEQPTTTSNSNQVHASHTINMADTKHPGEKKKFELTDQTNMLPKRQLIPVLMALNAVVLVSLLDQTIVSTAIPTISAHFNAGKSIYYIPLSLYLYFTRPLIFNIALRLCCILCSCREFSRFNCLPAVIWSILRYLWEKSYAVYLHQHFHSR